MSASSSRGSVSTFGLAGRPVTVFAPSQSDTLMPLDTEKSPSQSSIGSPKRALSALGPASPSNNTSDLASPGEIRRLLEAKGSPTSFSPLRSTASPAQLPAGSERHELAEAKTTTVRTEACAGAETPLTQKGSELKVPSGPLVPAETPVSNQEASVGGPLVSAETPVLNQEASVGGPLVSAETPVSNQEVSVGGPIVSAETPVLNQEASVGGPLVSAETPVSNQQASVGGPLVSAETPVSNQEASVGGPLVSAETPVSNQEASVGGPLVSAETPVSNQQASVGGPLVSAETPVSNQEASIGGSSQLTVVSEVDKTLRKESSPGRGLADLDKDKSSVTAITEGAGAGTGFDGHQLNISASAELLAPSTKTSEDRISTDQIIDARQLQADKSAEVIESTNTIDKSVALFVEKRASADIVTSVQKKQSNSGVESVEKSAIASPEADAKGSSKKKKGKKGQKGRKVPKGSTASADDENLSISEHIAHAITESSPEFADIPLQVNMTIDLVPPKNTGPASPARTIMSPVHIERKMIVESCKDGHVEVKVPPIFIDSPEGKHTTDEALNVSVSVDVGKHATQGHMTPQEECRHAEKQ
ncbi:neurofilament heavy polypeptide-like isoform X1 [Dermacentor silvarum]|uniref:neurofilament heavy polypeptide-like isoform X1 n=1 Tax=Dermacentor silvarum TaxID=543639 RepID=UPI0021014D6A|nr:neurofilament heavy polypeptide-like isoform X1 [Dermacentor silvarum]